MNQRRNGKGQGMDGEADGTGSWGAGRGAGGGEWGCHAQFAPGRLEDLWSSRKSLVVQLYMLEFFSERHCKD